MRTLGAMFVGEEIKLLKTIIFAVCKECLLMEGFNNRLKSYTQKSLHIFRTPEIQLQNPLTHSLTVFFVLMFLYTP
jgi:hypothetical protein